ncbi:hypothetical protein BSZ32_02430 [Rubritalea profundi]|uniref:Uncharacterized protein n=1 Tax=Rubritalea profundi TaxID=1658618 RepID=A0A2S7TZA8_9BACT|nr:hypothetical protein BSZ32_02430 [Rubritalea profundi]
MRSQCQWKIKTIGVETLVDGERTSTATRNPKAAKILALLRGALLAVIPFHEHDQVNGAMAHYANHPWQNINLINKLIISAPNQPITLFEVSRPCAILLLCANNSGFIGS